METIPPEIWNEIFYFSCTDDGYTGRALSAVSRAVHLTSKPFKYQSLCITGLNPLLKLLDVLSKLSSGQRKVRYLFIGSLDDFDGADERISPRFLADPIQDADQALCRILCLVSPSLLVLHIHRTTIARQSLFPEIPFPALTELVLHGPFRSLPPTSLRPFPRLRIIHIAHSSFYPQKFLQQIVHAAPLLTHLRVPQSSFPPYDIQVALGLLRPVQSASEPVYLPSSLERLVIEAEPLQGSSGPWAGDMRVTRTFKKFPETVDSDAEPVGGSLDSWAGNMRETQFFKKFHKIAVSDGRVCLVAGRRDWIPIEQAKREWLGDAACNFSVLIITIFTGEHGAN
ncbi:hypothetical protein B0H19DRAFT_1154124 [Mycena capillaripes]|nr:hypothetical protein B0H19DRAFT_1154124 [Mycena capillaripes]